jgi:hypothetical protein
MPPRTKLGSKRELEGEEEAPYGSFDNEAGTIITIPKNEVTNLLEAFRNNKPLDISNLPSKEIYFNNRKIMGDIFNSLVKKGDLDNEDYMEWMAFFLDTPKSTPKKLKPNNTNFTPDQSRQNSAASTPDNFKMEGFGIRRVYMKGFSRIKGAGIGSSRIFPSTKSDKEIIDDIRRMAEYGSPALRSEVEYHLRQSKFGFGMSSKNLMSLRDFVANQVGIEVP